MQPSSRPVHPSTACRLSSHTGPAVVFSGSADLAERIVSIDLQVTADSVLVLQNIGPVGTPGMPEAGLIPIPRKLAAQGVQDMLCISDGRMSGTAGGSVVLHKRNIFQVAIRYHFHAAFLAFTLGLHPPCR
jgi:dihydroxyacid dehydratase/phosphogluconate dehydratase